MSLSSCPPPNPCQSDETCCVNDEQQKACCAGANAVCCHPGDYCCPHGTTCCTDVSLCCPWLNAVCCPDGIHCCPQNNVCKGPYCSPIDVSTLPSIYGHDHLDGKLKITSQMNRTYVVLFA